MARKRRRKRAPSPPKPNDDLSVTEVALLLGVGYQRARNAMLAGRLGEAKYDRVSRQLSVKRFAVEAFKAARELSSDSKDSAAQRTAK